MGMYLNSIAPYMNYQEMAADPYYVDKSAMIKEFMETLGTPDKHICITRPRRFGKTVIANMLAAFFSKGMDSREIFQNLRIAETAGYREHMNNMTLSI